MVYLNLGRQDILRLLTPSSCRAEMKRAFLALADHTAEQPQRLFVRPAKTANWMAVMPCYSGGERPFFAVKSVCICPSNPERGMDAHQGVVLLLDGDTGELRAAADASTITALRTAAVTALATEYLARSDARILTLIGSGHQAGPHLRALAEVIEIDEVRVASSQMAHARAFTADQQPRYDFPVRAFESIEQAVRGADVVTTLTTSSTPVLNLDWLSPGTHLNAIGSSVPEAAEVDPETVKACRVVVDRRESALIESGEIRAALDHGAIDCNHIAADLGEILSGRQPGRSGTLELTLFISQGLAIEDLYATAGAYRAATREQGRASAKEG